MALLAGTGLSSLSFVFQLRSDEQNFQGVSMPKFYCKSQLILAVANLTINQVRGVDRPF